MKIVYDRELGRPVLLQAVLGGDATNSIDPKSGGSMYKEERFTSRADSIARRNTLKSLGIRDVIQYTDFDWIERDGVKVGVTRWCVGYPADTKFLTVEATGTVEEDVSHLLPAHELGGEG